VRFLTLLLSLALLGCAGSVSDYVQETPGGNLFIKEILEPTNLLTCKKAAYCKDLQDSEWEECKTQKQADEAFKTHVEVPCFDIATGHEFILSLKEWDEKKHQFGEYRNEDIFALLDNAQYVMKKTELYNDKVPKMIEDFKEFHFERE